MKKFALALAALVAAPMSAMAADITEIWDRIKAEKGMTVAEVPAEKAAAEGFATLYVANNMDPDADDIARASHHAQFVEDSQKITSVTRQDVTVSVYAAPADAAGTMYKLMILVTGDGAEKNLVCLYGTCTRDQMTKAVSNLSLEDVIGG